MCKQLLLCDIIILVEGASLLTCSFVIFVPFNGILKGKGTYVMKDEKKHHGAVDEASSEQQFRKLDMLCEKSGAILLVLEGLTAGWR